MMTSTGGTEDEVKARIQKANAAFIQLYPAWRAREISTKTKLKILRALFNLFSFLHVKLANPKKKDFKRLTHVRKYMSQKNFHDLLAEHNIK
jgi:hypothetical protein